MKLFRIRVLSVPCNLAMACGEKITERIIPRKAASYQEASRMAEQIANDDQTRGFDTSEGDDAAL